MLTLQLVRTMAAILEGRKLQVREDVLVHQALDEGHLQQVRDGGLQQLPSQDHGPVRGGHDQNLNL